MPCVKWMSETEFWLGGFPFWRVGVLEEDRDIHLECSGAKGEDQKMSITVAFELELAAANSELRVRLTSNAFKYLVTGEGDTEMGKMFAQVCGQVLCNKYSSSAPQTRRFSEATHSHSSMGSPPSVATFRPARVRRQICESNLQLLKLLVGSKAGLALVLFVLVANSE